MWIIVVFIMVVGTGTMTYRAATDHTEPKTVTPKAISLVAPTPRQDEMAAVARRHFLLLSDRSRQPTPDLK